MSDWRKEARKRLPQYSALCEEESTIRDLWRELESELQGIYQQIELDESLIAEIYDYASWCFNQALNSNPPDSETLTAVVGFYEVLASPSFYRVRDDMARWLSVEDFQRLYAGGAFRYYLFRPVLPHADKRLLAQVASSCFRFRF